MDDSFAGNAGIPRDPLILSTNARVAGVALGEKGISSQRYVDNAFLLCNHVKKHETSEESMSQMRKDVFTGRWVVMAETTTGAVLGFSFQEIR